MILRRLSGANKLFEPSFAALRHGKVSAPVALLICLLIPLKLSLAYVVMVPALAAWLWFGRASLRNKVSGCSFLTPFHLFLLCAFCGAFFGVQPLRSLAALPAFLFFSFLVLLLADAAPHASAARLIAALVSGQALAAFYSLLEVGSGHQVQRLFLGEVTESGQIALSFVAGIGLLFHYRSRTPSAGTPPLPPRASLLGPLSFILFFATAFAGTFNVEGALFAVLALAAAVPALYAVVVLLRAAFSRSADEAWAAYILGRCILPMIGIALLANLKRGPWLGVLAGSCLFLLLHRKRLVVPLLLIAAVLFLSLAPLRTRLQQSMHDFYISGGRRIMWQVGAELAARYPLGIGFENSVLQRRFALEIPRQHEHFHNNFINVLVETGWIGFSLFLWWLASILKSAFRAPLRREDAMLANGIGCAVISMMTAGLVEYNFGDSEVCLVLFVLLGALARLTGEQSAAS